MAETTSTPIDPNNLVNQSAGVLNLAGNIGLGIVGNAGERIRGQYQVKLQELLNDKSLTKAEFDERMAKLNAERDILLAQTKREARMDYLKIGAVVGVFLLALFSLWWTFRRERKN